MGGGGVSEPRSFNTLMCAIWCLPCPPLLQAPGMFASAAADTIPEEEAEEPAEEPEDAPMDDAAQDDDDEENDDDDDDSD